MIQGAFCRVTYTADDVYVSVEGGDSGRFLFILMAEKMSNMVLHFGEQKAIFTPNIELAFCRFIHSFDYTSNK